MFDYQAGEKYRLTLIMVGLAGLMAGMFITVLLMPTPEPTRNRQGHASAYSRDPDVTGTSARAVGGPYSSGAAQAMTPAARPANMTDPTLARTLVEQWLPLAWDLSAGTAKDSQTKAMQYMTAECAAAYQQNIWTPDLAKQIDESGLQSTFRPASISASDAQEDGTVIVFVDGQQILSVPGKGETARAVKLEYMVKQTASGLRIAGISEGGKGFNQ